MVTMQELRKKRRAIAQLDMQAGFVTGYTGQINPDGSHTTSDKYGTIYVRIGATRADDVRPATRVSNSRVDTAFGLPVVLWKLNGKWDVFCLNTPRAVDQLGARVGNAATPRRVGDDVAETVLGRRIKPGRVRVWNTGTLELNAEAFVYLDSAGVLKQWEPDATNSLDIASLVPAAVGGVDQGCWVWLALNPDATTPVLEALDDTPVSTLLHNDADTRWQAIAIPDGYYPLDAVWLQTGDTTITSESRYAFGRLLLDKVGSTGTGTAIVGNVTELLNFVESTDVHPGTAITGTSSWYDLCANQSFTVTDSAAMIEFNCIVSFTLGNTGGNDYEVRLNIDSGGTPILEDLGSGKARVGLSNGAGIAHPPKLILSAGMHTVKVQIRAVASDTLYMRASTQPIGEKVKIRVYEYPLALV